MRIAVVEHHDDSSVAVVGETARDLGAELETFWGARGDTLPVGIDDHDALVVLGGAMNAADDVQCPYFPHLLGLIRGFTAAEKPVLGICLGAQLVARAFDAPLHLAGHFEFGFHPIEPTAAAKDDPVLSMLEAPLPLFQWHTDHYDLPPSATRLAQNDTYQNQAYRIAKATYGAQFHFEMDRETVDRWIAANPDLDEKKPGFRDWLPQQFVAHEEDSKAFCRNFVRRWLGLAA